MRIDLREFSGVARRNRWEFAVLLSVTLLCGLLIGTVLPGRGAVAAKIDKDSATPLAIPDPIHLSSAFASIVQSVEPAVVNISTTQVDRKSTRLNSSHTVISYAVFCLKKKNK